MRKFGCFLFVLKHGLLKMYIIRPWLKRLYICYYIICMTVPLNVVKNILRIIVVARTKDDVFYILDFKVT